MITHEEAVALSKKARSNAEEFQFDEYVADLDDRIERIVHARAKLKAELDGYKADWDASSNLTIPTVPKSELAKSDDPHGDAIRLLEGPLFEAEVQDAKRVTARRRLAHGVHEDLSLAGEEKALRDLRKQL